MAIVNQGNKYSVEFLLFFYAFMVRFRIDRMRTFQSRYIVSHKKPFSVEYGVPLKVFASFSVGSF